MRMPFHKCIETFSVIATLQMLYEAEEKRKINNIADLFKVCILIGMTL